MWVDAAIKGAIAVSSASGQPKSVRENALAVLLRLGKDPNSAEVLAAAAATANRQAAEMAALRVENSRLRAWVEERSSAAGAGKEEDEGKNISERCMICLENVKKVAIVPCGHVAFCEECSPQVNDRCPVCRERIQGKMVVYI